MTSWKARFSGVAVVEFAWELVSRNHGETGYGQMKLRKGQRLINVQQLVRVSPDLDYDHLLFLKDGERAPEGYVEGCISADDLPKGWPPEEPCPCPCKCGKTFRIGDRTAVRNLRNTGLGIHEEVARTGYVIKLIHPNGEDKYIADENDTESKLFDSFEEASKFPYSTIEAAADFICGLPEHIDCEIIQCTAKESPAKPLE
jgi:hypothetical protein